MSEYKEVEQPFLEQLTGLGWVSIDQGSDIPQDPTTSLRQNFRQWILPEVFNNAVSAINIGHLLTAINTGFISAVAATIVLITKPNYLENKYIIAGVTGLCTAIADIIVHPSGFGGFSTEAIVTGIGAGLLTIAFAKIKNV